MIKYKRIILTTISLILFVNISNGQYLEKVGNNKWTDGTKIDKLHKFEYLFQENDYQKNRFKKFNRARKAHTYSNVFGAALTTFTTISAIETLNNSTGGLDVAFANFTFLIGPTYLALSNLIFIPIRISRKNKLLKSIDNKVRGIHEYNNTQNINLTFSNSINGVSLILSF